MQVSNGAELCVAVHVVVKRLHQCEHRRFTTELLIRRVVGIECHARKDRAKEIPRFEARPRAWGQNLNIPLKR